MSAAVERRVKSCVRQSGRPLKGLRWRRRCLRDGTVTTTTRRLSTLPGVRSHLQGETDLPRWVPISLRGRSHMAKWRQYLTLWVSLRDLGIMIRNVPRNSRHAAHYRICRTHPYFSGRRYRRSAAPGSNRRFADQAHLPRCRPPGNRINHPGCSDE